MNDEEIRKMIENTGTYDDSREDTLRSMISDFYSRRMLSTAILVWVNFLLFLALAIVSAVLFFRTDRTQYQIMYAALFVCFMQWSTLGKIFAWQVIHKNSIKREIVRMGIRLADISQKLQRQSGA